MSSKNMKFVLLGAKGTGKTMFITYLEKGTNKKIISHGDDTRNYIKDKWEKLRREEGKCKLPPTPATYTPLQFVYQHDEFEKIEFSFHDYDGNFTETIMAKTDKTEEELEEKIKQLSKDIYTEVFSKDESSKVALKKELARYKAEKSVLLTKKQREELLQSVKENPKPKGIFFFLPYDETPDDYQSFAQNIGKFIELAQFSNKSKSPIPACIVITKWDDAEGFQKENEKQLAREYLESNEYLKDVLNMVENYFEHVEIVPVSSCKSYNLTAPFDFGLEKTFEQWNERVLELKKEKKFEKLVIYMANRYEDMQFVKKYDFKVLYDEVQKEYFSIVEKEFYAFENYEEREKYLNNVTPLFKTKPELLEQLKKALEVELRHIKIKKVRNVTLSIVAIVTFGVGLLEYKMKLDVDEAYTSIKQRYQKKVLYPRMEMDIHKFLENYKSVNFLYAWANVPKKRAEVIKMRDDLKVQYKEWIDNRITNILTNKKLAADEQRLKLKELRSQADTLDQRKIDEIMANLGLSINKERWLSVAKDCLKTCEGETGKETIATLVSQVNEGGVVLDDTVKGLLDQLTQKKVSIIEKGSMEKILAKIEEQSDANKLTAFLSDFSSDIKHLPKVQEAILIQYISFLEGMDIGQVVSLFPSMESNDEESNQTIGVSKAAIPDDVVASDRFRNALVLVLEEKYEILKGNSLLESLKFNRNPNKIQETLTDIKKKIDQNAAFDELSKEIEDTPFDNLKVIEFSKYNNLTDDQKESIPKMLTKKLDVVLESLLLKYPNEATETEKMEYKDKIFEQLNGYKLEKVNYTYIVSQDIIDANKKAIDKRKKLENEGLDGITVSLDAMKAENSVGLECGDDWTHNTDIYIEGFGVKLSNDKVEGCNNNKLTYKDTISLTAKQYCIDIKEDRYLSPRKMAKECFVITLDDLYTLEEGKPVAKSVDKENMKIIFIQRN